MRPRSKEAQQGGVGCSFLRASNLHRQHLPKALLVHPYAHQERHAPYPRPPANLQVGGVQVQIGVALLLQRALPPLPLLLFEPTGDAAYGVLADPHSAQRLGDAGYLPDRDPGEVHLKDRFFHVSCHALVALKYLSYELALAVARHLKTLDPACGRDQVTCVVAVALPSPGRSELAVAGFSRPRGAGSSPPGGPPQGQPLRPGGPWLPRPASRRG